MTSESSEPSSRFFPIDIPTASETPIKIHALIYHPLSASTNNATSAAARSHARPTIIALHYWGGSASTFRHVPSLLQRRQAATSHYSTVISVSHRGWGLSSPASPDTASAYSVTALASDVVALLPHFFELDLIPQSGFVLCGYSMGAKVAVAVAGSLHHAKLPLGFPPLRGILLLAPAPLSPLVLPDELKEQQVHAYESPESVDLTVREVLTGARRARSYGGKEDLDLLVRDSLAGSDGAKKGWPEVGMAQNVNLDGLCDRISGSVGNQSKVKFRVLASRGDRVETVDRVERDTVQPLRSNGFEVELRVLEPEKHEDDEAAYGHILPLEAPDIVSEELVVLLNDIDDTEVKIDE